MNFVTLLEMPMILLFRNLRHHYIMLTCIQTCFQKCLSDIYQPYTYILKLWERF